MFVKPRVARSHGGSKSAAGLFFVVVGALIFVRIVQGYMEHMMPIVTAEQVPINSSLCIPPTYYYSPDRILHFRVASSTVTSSVHKSVEDQIRAIRTQDVRTAVQLTTNNFGASSPDLFESMFQSQYPELVTGKINFDRTKLLHHGAVAVQQVSANVHDEDVEFTYVLINGQYGWKIASISRGSFHRSTLEADCMDIDQYASFGHGN